MTIRSNMGQTELRACKETIREREREKRRERERERARDIDESGESER